jgi:hypothetical protein
MASSKHEKLYKTLECKRCDRRVDCLTRNGHLFWIAVLRGTVWIPCEILRPLVKGLVWQLATLCLGSRLMKEGKFCPSDHIFNILDSKNRGCVFDWSIVTTPELINFLEAEARRRKLSLDDGVFRSPDFCRSFLYGLERLFDINCRVRRRIKYVTQKRVAQLKVWEIWTE